MLRVITRTFLDVFPDAQAWLLSLNVDAPVLGLIGSIEPRRYSSRWVEGRLSEAKLEAELKKLALADSIRLFGSFVAGPKALLEFAGDAPLNTDDRPRVIFGAPQFAYQKKATPYIRLLTLLRIGSSRAEAGLSFGPDPDADPFAARLAKFVSARDVFLNGLIDDAEGRRARAIDAFVESARLSEEFTAGYAQCLSLAAWQAKSKPEEARALLQRLVEAQPSLPIARDLLRRLSKETGQ
jgi:spermidine synthase